MTKMRAIEAAVHILKKEGLVNVFGVPGAALSAPMTQIRIDTRSIVIYHIQYVNSCMGDSFNACHLPAKNRVFGEEKDQRMC